jgi:acid stress-induced BolA-like protein IbaG/YrbA
MGDVLIDGGPMSLPVFDSWEDVAAEMRRCILATIPDARVEVTPKSPGHFEIQASSGAFAGKSRVQQQQLVYGAIAHLMQGEDAPVHAIDQMRLSVPGGG